MIIKRLVCLVCILILFCIIAACCSYWMKNENVGVGYIDSFHCKYCGNEFSIAPNDLFEIEWQSIFGYKRVSKAVKCPECETTYAYLDSTGWTYVNVPFESVNNR